jgi:hypothetical protein
MDGKLLQVISSVSDFVLIPIFVGFDAVSGLGTPNFPTLSHHILRLP